MFGKVKRLTDRGFGFITPDGSSKDIFFHASNLEGVTFDELHDGDMVEFEVMDSEKGQKAVGITLVS